ncbi:catalase family protein [Stenotrophomonas sp. PFBMAA-4]|uniref:catalase family protein n=1 Tax=Stenotrophomonas sp. PFBMAA-4 TaxID=3043301 RepID=UPI0024B491B6|nr:catalase family protein [Stenotrophomonas sp. PFBMAA-4]MDI9274747.1 catalase family protein [Stenotrophomonas sp. PFBMAA-4]
MRPLLSPVPFHAGMEQPEADEAETIDALRDVFLDMARTVAAAEGHAHRAVHAKGQALLKGKLQIADNLPEELAHGLFAAPGAYEAVVRFSSPPAEQLPDTVSTPRAIALKILGVPGERVSESEEQHSQDFLMVNGPAFTSPGPKGFLRSTKLLAATTERMPRTKAVISAALRGGERLLEAAGGGSGKIKGMGGEPQTHPMGETFFSQVPFRFGPYVAKFCLRPVSATLQSLSGAPVENSEDSQRDAIQDALASGRTELVWELCAQLCRDEQTMPIEDASVEWPQEQSPFIAVATLHVPPQVSWDDAESPGIEDRLAFSPWHALQAHRPLGALNRARRVVMAASRAHRSQHNGCPLHEPLPGA